MTISKIYSVREPDFKKIYQYANKILVRSSVIGGFPFKAKALVKEQTDIAFCTFEKANNKYRQDIRQFGSDSAVLMEMRGAYIIFYNESEALYRIRFSIMHELGHYLLGHKLNLNLEDDLYGVQEIEANCFAAQVLMPEQLLRVCSKRGKTLSDDFIIRSFEVSREAAQKRRNTLAKTVYEWRSREESRYDDNILNKYADLIDRIAPLPTSTPIPLKMTMSANRSEPHC
jgi:Zn-dependent peptidase ImmA (M78 family)